jgi:hypothetical protein
MALVGGATSLAGALVLLARLIGDVPDRGRHAALD